MVGARERARRRGGWGEEESERGRAWSAGTEGGREREREGGSERVSEREKEREKERERQKRSGFLSFLYLSGSLFSLSAATTSQHRRLLADFTKAIQHMDAEEREGGREGGRNGRGRRGGG